MFWGTDRFPMFWGTDRFPVGRRRKKAEENIVKRITRVKEGGRRKFLKNL